MKLDAKFYGTIIKVKDNTTVPEDQYVVFLAKDNAFAAVLPTYREKCVELGCDNEQIAAVDKLIVRLNSWRQENQDKLKIPDAKGERLLDQSE